MTRQATILITTMQLRAHLLLCYASDAMPAAMSQLHHIVATVISAAQIQLAVLQTKLQQHPDIAYMEM